MNSKLYTCNICLDNFDDFENFQEHRGTDRHREKWLNRKYRIKRKEFIGSKNGIVLTASPIGNTNYFYNNRLTSSIELSLGESESSLFDISIKNGSQKFYYLHGWDIVNKNLLIENSLSLTINDKNHLNTAKKLIRLREGATYNFRCQIGGAENFRRSVRVAIIFRIEDSIEIPKTFYCGLDLVIKPNDAVLFGYGDYIPGVSLRSTAIDLLPMVQPLQSSRIPEKFQMMACNNEAGAIHSYLRSSSKLEPHNYAAFFKTLMWLEELQLQIDIQYYSKSKVCLIDAGFVKNVPCHELMIEGLSENRPCVMEKDEIFAKVSSEDRNEATYYQGIVHKVLSKSVYLAFDPSFQYTFGRTKEFDIEFIINRHPMKVGHRAVETCNELKLHNFLFPRVPTGNISLPTQISPYNRTLINNKEQMEAVKHIVARSSGSAPYLVFGPPGTGKTITLVEAIKQILFRDQETHIMACAPSNSAADILAERLLDHFNETHVFRVYAKSRSNMCNMISPKLRSASNFKNGEVFYPEMEVFAQKRVIVCTYTTAARIASADFPVGHFTHVILDEAGHSTEPEAVVAIANILDSSGQLVLAGDHHQLGPIVRNMQAQGNKHIFTKNGLDTSYLERLMMLDMYKPNAEGKFNKKVVTKLLQNYRSNSHILHVSNKLFYGSELKVKGNPEVINSLCSLGFLPKKGFPVIFHSVSGRDQTNRNSPSYFNPEEVKEAIHYVQLCLQSISPKIIASEIGIITPYRLQVQKIRDALRSRWPGIKVGSVEDFQGEERRVVIISTVRSSQHHLAKDEIFKLGFVRNKKRLNVALTRAKALLIVIGCPMVLQLDSNWKTFIDYVKEQGGYVGRVAPPPLTDIDKILKETEELDLTPLSTKISEMQIVEALPIPGY